MKPINEMSLNECVEALRLYAENIETPYTEMHQLANRIEELTRWIPVGEETIPDGKLLRVKIKNPDVETFGFYDKELGKWGCAVPGAEVTHYQSMTFPDTITQTN
jgi:hypothetical protein